VSPLSRPLLEVCVQSSTDASLAAEGGADRVELCQAIELGGLTPSAGTISSTCASSALPVIVLTRPRAGDFIYSSQEIDAVTRDLEQLKALGAHGAAFGALTPQGDIDQSALEIWIAASQGLELVFHRAFDSCKAPLESLELLAECGIHRVLSSGGAATAAEGADELAIWIEAMRGRVEILPGGSIRASNVAALVAKTGAEGVHFRAPSIRRREGAAHPLGISDNGNYEVTDPSIVCAIRDALS
jgi:copper homeostasis protein